MQQYRNNPLAPPWLWGGSYCEPPGSADEFFIYVLRKDQTAAQRTNNAPFLFDGDGCFLWRLQGSGTAQVADGPTYFAWRDQNGRQLSNQPLALGGYCGGQASIAPVVPIEQIEPGARWAYDAINTSAGISTLFFMLIGVKRRKVAA